MQTNRIETIGLASQTNRVKHTSLSRDVVSWQRVACAGAPAVIDQPAYDVLLMWPSGTNRRTGRSPVPSEYWRIAATSGGRIVSYWLRRSHAVMGHVVKIVCLLRNRKWKRNQNTKHTYLHRPLTLTYDHDFLSPTSDGLWTIYMQCKISRSKVSWFTRWSGNKRTVGRTDIT